MALFWGFSPRWRREERSIVGGVDRERFLGFVLDGSGCSTFASSIVQYLLHPVGVCIKGVGLSDDLAVALQDGVEFRLGPQDSLLLLARHFLLRLAFLLLL